MHGEPVARQSPSSRQSLAESRGGGDTSSWEGWEGRAAGQLPPGSASPHCPAPFLGFIHCCLVQAPQNPARHSEGRASFLKERGRRTAAVLGHIWQLQLLQTATSNLASDIGAENASFPSSHLPVYPQEAPVASHVCIPSG